MSVIELPLPEKDKDNGNAGADSAFKSDTDSWDPVLSISSSITKGSLPYLTNGFLRLHMTSSHALFFVYLTVGRFFPEQLKVALLEIGFLVLGLVMDVMTLLMANNCFISLTS